MNSINQIRYLCSKSVTEWRMLMLVIMSCHSYPGHTEQAGNSLVANRSVIEMYWINIGILKMCIQSGTTPGIIYFCVQIFTKNIS